MALGPVSTWVDAFTEDGATDSPSWSQNLADTVSSLTTAKLELATPYEGAEFTFGTEAFKSALDSIKPGTGPGGIKFATAWAAGVTASVMLPGEPEPPFSIIATVVIDAMSVQAAKIALDATIDNNPPGADAMQTYASAFHTAFASLTCTLLGSSTAVPPVPISEPSVPVL